MRTTACARMLVSVLVAGLLASALAGCGTAGQSNSSTSYTAPSAKSSGGVAPLPAPGGANDSAGQAELALAPASTDTKRTADRMVIRNANVRLEVAKVPDAVSSVRSLAKKYGGVVSQLQLSSDTGDGTPQPVEGSERTIQSGLPYNASLTVLVPVAKYDDFRAEASKLGKVLSESSADDDVTQQHVDLKARLDNAKAEEQRLRTFFDNAKSVTDMLAIEKELARVRGDIESMTAQITTMERQAAMGTLTIELVEPKAIVRPENGIDWGFAEALTTGIQGLAGVTQGLIVLAIGGLPFWIGIVALVLIVRWRIRVGRARKAAMVQAAPAVQEPPAPEAPVS